MKPIILKGHEPGLLSLVGALLILSWCGTNAASHDLSFTEKYYNKSIPSGCGGVTLKEGPELSEFRHISCGRGAEYSALLSGVSIVSKQIIYVPRQSVATGMGIMIVEGYYCGSEAEYEPPGFVDRVGYDCTNSGWRQDRNPNHYPSVAP